MGRNGIFIDVLMSVVKRVRPGFTLRLRAVIENRVQPRFVSRVGNEPLENARDAFPTRELPTFARDYRVLKSTAQPSIGCRYIVIRFADRSSRRTDAKFPPPFPWDSLTKSRRLKLAVGTGDRRKCWKNKTRGEVITDENSLAGGFFVVRK